MKRKAKRFPLVLTPLPSPPPRYYMPLFISSFPLTIPHANSGFISCDFYGYGQVILIFNTVTIFLFSVHWWWWYQVFNIRKWPEEIWLWQPYSCFFLITSMEQKCRSMKKLFRQTLLLNLNFNGPMSQTTATIYNQTLVLLTLKTAATAELNAVLGSPTSAW